MADESTQCFNSKLVRLKVPLSILWQHCLFRFNSKLVRLKAIYAINTGTQRYRFNSKLVRLKEMHRSQPSNEKPKFQFQTGSIKSLTHPRAWRLGRSFNSKLVRLKVNLTEQQLITMNVSIPNWFD